MNVLSLENGKQLVIARGDTYRARAKGTLHAMELELRFLGDVQFCSALVTIWKMDVGIQETFKWCCFYFSSQKDTS